MKPLRLEMQAFGPFAGEQVIDFRELGERSFFLIHGSTGSGKTTILDAICFALYGDSSGAERSGEQMCSDFAEAGVITLVRFNFALGAKHYRVYRSPRQMRPAKRGDKMVEAQPEAELYELGESKEMVLASGWQRVNEEVEKLLGFRSGEFRQVVMLPQGKFRQLLMADSREREKILETLFRTSLYNRIEVFLKQQADLIKDRITRLNNESSFILQEAQVASEEELLNQSINDQQKAEDMALHLQEGQIREDALRKQVNQAQQVQLRLDELTKARQEYEKLDEQCSPMQEQRREMERARRAAQLIPIEQTLIVRKKEVEVAAAEYEQAVKALTDAEESRDKARGAYEEEQKKENQRQKVQENLHHLNSLEPLVTGLEEAARELEDALDEQQTLQKEKDKLDGELVKTSKELLQKQEELKQEQELAVTLPAREVEYQEKKKFLDKLIKRSQLEGNLTGLVQECRGAQESYTRSEKRYLNAKKQWNKLFSSWSQGQAALLASRLTAGAPCPVCGSLHHPNLAISSGDLPAESDLQAQQAEMDEAEHLKDTLQGQWQDKYWERESLKKEIALLEADLSYHSSKDLNLIENELKQAQLEMDMARFAAKRASDLETKITRLQVTEKTMAKSLQEQSDAVNQAAIKVGEAQARYQEKAGLVPEQLRNIKMLKSAQEVAFKQVQQLQRQLEQGRESYQKAENMLASASSALTGLAQKEEQARKRWQDDNSNFKTQLEGAGFAGWDDYHQARRNPAQLTQLEQSIKNFDESLRSAADRLQRAEIAAEGLAEPELEVWQEALEGIIEQNQGLLKKKSLLEEELKRKQDWLQRLHGLEGQLAQEEESYRVTGHLAAVANGQNAMGMTFQRFVLGALLEEVVTVASERLRIMSRGRFLLQRTLDRKRSNAAGGLDIVVFDNHSGTARPVSSLSGGESFLASLSLALGLAEVVQSYAGGIRLDAIFIDEGFGSLDSDSLDFAVRVLIDLQQEGRLVGIISHIEELKERIDARLEVQKQERGSIARFQIS